MNPLPAQNHPQPQSLSDLFVSFTWLALQGFGGVLAIVQREMVEQKRWMTREEFIEYWAVAPIMPAGRCTGAGGHFDSEHCAGLRRRPMGPPQPRVARFQAGHGAHRGGAPDCGRMNTDQRQRQFIEGLEGMAADGGDGHDPSGAPKSTCCGCWAWAPFAFPVRSGKNPLRRHPGRNGRQRF